MTEATFGFSYVVHNMGNFEVFHWVSFHQAQISHF